MQREVAAVTEHLEAMSEDDGHAAGASGSKEDFSANNVG
jgi:hypothetical protein